MSSPTGYQLARRHHSGIIMGLSAVQTGLLAIAIGAGVLLPTLTHTRAGLLAGASIAICCAVAAFLPVQGRPLHIMLPSLIRFTLTKASGGNQWSAPSPRMTATPSGRLAPRPGLFTTRRRELPRCLSGLELHHAEQPGWSEDARPPVGIIRDNRTGALTVILTVRGSHFGLIDPIAQHSLLKNWGHVLNQFGRESSPLTRIGWSLWSAPRTLLHPANSSPADESLNETSDLVRDQTEHQQRAAASYQRLLNEHPSGYRHELRVWISIDPSRASGRHPDPTRSALAAAASLTERCQAAGLVVSGPLSPAQITDAIRLHADPFTTAAAQESRPAPRPGTTRSQHLVDAAPQTVHTHWDAVQIESAWHRSFWVAGWPGAITQPEWLTHLLHDPAGIQAITVMYEPISLRASRRRITADSVALDSQLQLRHKHDFRIPVHLHHAQADIDQREAELGAGWCEFAHLTLITVTGTTRDDLDHNSQALLDQAAQCGVSALRPLHAHHDAAWAATLPLGRVPDREFLAGAHP